MSVESVELLRQENKKRIMQASKDLLNVHNPARLSLGEIARYAGVSVKTINNIFGTKNSLLILVAHSALTEEHEFLDALAASREFAEKSGLDQVMDLHYARAKFARSYPYVSGVISEIERLKLASETETRQCNQYILLADGISAYYDAPIEKGCRDGSIKKDIPREQIRPLLAFSFGAVTQRLQTINRNRLLGRQVDSYEILRAILKMTKDYLASPTVCGQTALQEERRNPT